MVKMNVIDTNVIIQFPDIILKMENILLPIAVLEELDKHKGDEGIGHKVRRGIKNIFNNIDKIQFDVDENIDTKYFFNINLDFTKNDNKILFCALRNDATLISNDINLIVKAKSFKVSCMTYNDIESDQYLGYIEVCLTDEEMADFYENKENTWNLLENQYIVIKDKDGKICDKLKWTDKGFKSISYKIIDSKYVGKVKPRNLQQELYMDILQDKDIKVKACMGNFGTGKDYLALATFLSYIEKGMYDKIIWIRNTIEADGTKPIGFLPGNLTEKLSVYADIVGDFVGGKLGFEMLLNSGKLELVHAGFLRGRDLRNSIIYCTEAQNMSKSLVQLILSRISEGSMIFFNGDVKQTDLSIFKQNNGLDLLINRLKGNSNFGYVYLDKCERSEVAQLADLLD